METTSDLNTWAAMFDAMQESCQVVRQSGRSMINPKSPEHSIPPESYVEVRPVSGRTIEWGEVYCIYTDGGHDIKRLYPGDDDEHLKCVSFNESEGFLPYQLPKSEIKGLALVTRVLQIKSLHW